jgi:hypothetical protein
MNKLILSLLFVSVSLAVSERTFLAKSEKKGILNNLIFAQKNNQLLQQASSPDEQGPAREEIKLKDLIQDKLEHREGKDLENDAPDRQQLRGKLEDFDANDDKKLSDEELEGIKYQFEHQGDKLVALESDFEEEIKLKDLIQDKLENREDKDDLEKDAPDRQQLRGKLEDFDANDDKKLSDEELEDIKYQFEHQGDKLVA